MLSKLASQLMILLIFWTQQSSIKKLANSDENFDSSSEKLESEIFERIILIIPIDAAWFTAWRLAIV